MFKIFRHTTLGMLLLLVVPLIFWLSDWHWHPYKSAITLKWIFLIMETVTSPWVILTNLILNTWIFKCLHSKAKILLKLFCIINIIIIAGQQIKSFVKCKSQEPRPYIIWLEHHYGLNIHNFYLLKNKERSEIVSNLLNSNQILPVWLKRHWIHETGYSLPSGHTMFASSWALLTISLLWPYRCYKTIAIIFIWAYFVSISRMLFGMHWIQDLILANILAWMLVNLTNYLVDFNKLLSNNAKI
ncbi:phosphatidylglycerophosphatase B [Candidatus Pantoea edessiphila]|uniref:undecaprenyl-diphosphate phosphatase n=1 Tax=Candidatus Pantoea edessiphila TaxID=2044610 RepID=A0A2P5SWS0_9GAMM|nr:phosphatidylglycerophosphatase B [Candidatus Pantoea edessiphila]PPI86787.1 phosphatidylglycerophosphatase B [Candidatus Pantoea edessiphila]